MGFFKTKKEKALSEQMMREKAARYVGRSMQEIGRIPEGAEVEITLNPEEKQLNIHHGVNDISLPYNRILRFVVVDESTDIISRGAAVARELISRRMGERSKLLMSAGSKIVGKMVSQKKIVDTVAHLHYLDKQGEEKTICFVRSREFDHGCYEEVRDKDSISANFAEVVASVIGNQKEEVTEL